MDSTSSSTDFINTGRDLLNGLQGLQLSASEDEESFTSYFQSNFKPLKILGQGGFGCVFEAEKYVAGIVLLGKWAVKRIPIKKSDKAANDAVREVKALQKLTDDRIVKLVDAWTEEPPRGWQKWADAELLTELNSSERASDSLITVISLLFQFTYSDDSAFLYIQMEVCDSTLVDWLVSNADRDLNKIKDIFSDLVWAVAYIHQHKFIHRDLKPSNILFKDGKLKVCDLGIATSRELMSEEEGGKEVAIERTFAKGTILYMAPEQTGWADYSSKVDIFALGLILAEMCVVMTDDLREEVFENYRHGRTNTILQHIPEAETFVAWLTNPIDIERPDSDRLCGQSFLQSDQKKRDIRRMHQIRRGRMRTIGNAMRYKQMKKREEELVAADSGKLPES